MYISLQQWIPTVLIGSATRMKKIKSHILETYIF